MSQVIFCTGLDRLSGFLTDAVCGPTALELLLPIGILVLLYAYLGSHGSKKKIALGAAGVILILVQLAAPTSVLVGKEILQVAEGTQAKQNCMDTCDELKKDVNGSGIESWDNDSLDRAWRYCTYTFRWDRDGDGEYQEVSENLYSSFCEDGVRCFVVDSCVAGGVNLDTSTCKTVARKYLERKGQEASEDEVKQLFNRKRVSENSTKFSELHVGSCDLTNVEDSSGDRVRTWYSENFQ